MDNKEYQSSKLTFVLIDWARNNQNKYNLEIDIKQAYEHIEREHVNVNLEKDLPKFYHHFFPALYIKKLALDLIDIGFPVIELYKKYNEHLVWTKNS